MIVTHFCFRFRSILYYPISNYVLVNNFYHRYLILFDLILDSALLCDDNELTFIFLILPFRTFHRLLLSVNSIKPVIDKIFGNIQRTYSKLR
jgi:hypothetical protein